MTSPADVPPSKRPTSAQLRDLYEAGQRGPAIRAALGNWEEILGEDDVSWLQEALRTCGLPAEAFAVQVQVARRRAAAPVWHALVRSVLRSGDPWWAHELLDEARCDSRELQAVRIEAELAVGDASALIAAWLREHRDDAALEAAMAWWIRNGRVDEAERLLQSADGLTLWRARLAIWRNQPRAAWPFLSQLPATAEVRFLAAIAAVQEGRLAEAEALLRALQDGDARAEAGSWLATVLRKQGRCADALRAADAASIASSSFNLVTRLERELAADALGRTFLTRVLQRFGLRRRRVGDLEHADALRALGVSSRDPIETLAAVIERFGGNHTPDLTLAAEGKLTAYRLPRDPRELGAGIQLVLWTRGPAAARALYLALAPQVGDHPLFRIYHGELELWLGEYAAAERIFREIVRRDPSTKWAWIGLGASAMFQGRLDEAQATWEEGVTRTRFAGPTLYVYRGECFRRQGQMERARQDLEFAVRQKPHRISARVNLALLDRTPEALERAVRTCEAAAPLLLAELRGGPAEKLEGVLTAMRGNRSSSHVSYHLWDRVWRAVA